MFGVHAPQGQYEYAQEIGAEYGRVIQRWGVGISNLKGIAQDAANSSRKLILTLTSHEDPTRSQVWLSQIARGLPSVKYFQIENEILRQWQDFRDPINLYTAHLERSYETIKATRPDATVICAAYTGGVGSSPREVQGKSAYSRILRAGHYDLVDFHCYSDNWQEMLYRADWLRGAMLNPVPLVSLEAAGPWTTYSEARHATDVAQRMLGALGAGLQTVCWSSLIPTEGWGLQFERLALVAKNGRRLPAYWTYRLMTEKMANRTVQKRPIQSGFTAYGDAACFCVWSNTGSPKTLYLQNVPYPKAKVTTILTHRDEAMPAEATIPVEGGILKLQVDIPVFVEPIL